MNARLKQQRQDEANRRRKQRVVKVAFGTIVALIALVFALSFFTPTPADHSAGEGGFRRITASELKVLVDRGEVTIIDVRDTSAYSTAHIPGALQIPVSRIEGEIPYLPKGKPIVTYCTCPAEESSGLAVQILEHRGVKNAAALQGGLEAWQRSGYPIAFGSP
jgi:rhodanese-related sulfurtransferase